MKEWNRYLISFISNLLTVERDLSFSAFLSTCWGHSLHFLFVVPMKVANAKLGCTLTNRDSHTRLHKHIQYIHVIVDTCMRIHCLLI